jgi:hypothetical protein
MAGRVDGKAARVTERLKGSDAVMLSGSRRRADVLALDICVAISSVPYRQGTEKGLKQTVAPADALGRRAIGVRADVRESWRSGWPVTRCASTP